MSHGLGVVESVRDALPDVTVSAFLLVTQLGDTWLLLLLVVSLYLLGERVPLLGRGVGRRDAAFLLALGLGAVALTGVLKSLFGHPRPVGYDAATPPALLPGVLEVLYVDAATATGYSFPSGHAVGSTVVYGGIALASEVWTWRRRVLGAATIVALVATSRVVLGVHFLGDVLAGVVVGVAFLAAMQWFARGDPGRAFLLVVAVALLGLVVTGFAFEPLATLGGAIGARLAWGSVGEAVPNVHADAETGFLTFVGIPLVAVMFGLTYASDSLLAGEYLPAVAGFLGAGLTLGVLVSLPVFAREQVERRAG